jgi:hypothetical protein
MEPVINLLNRISGTIFYIMGSIYFVLYLLYFNDILTAWMRWIMELFDLSMILISLLYGGTSFLKSITDPDQPSLFALLIVGIPLVLLFGFFVVLNFWDAFGFGG